ncbi:MAG: response regulator [Gemmatimonadales bacterium]
MAEAIGPGARRLVLLVDNDVASRRQAREMLERRGLDVVQASNGMAALELIQRLPDSFRLVVADVSLPGLSGRVVIETLRLFRPDLPVICMAASLVVAGAIMRCLSKPLQHSELDAVLAEMANGWAPPAALEVPQSVVQRARQRFALAGDLVEAAIELSARETPTSEAD